MKEKLLQLKKNIEPLDSYYDNYPELKKIIDTLKMYIGRLFPNEKAEWEKRIDEIEYVSYPAQMLGYDNNRDRDFFKKGTKSLSYVIDQVIERMEMDEQHSSNVSNQPKLANNAKVFIVHGHDEAMRLDVKAILEKLHLSPVVLGDCANSGKTIIEKLEANSNVGFAIILLSPCDLGREKNDKEERPRARQNVIVEMGYFLGKLGRNRICILKKAEVEEPSDFDGVLYTVYDSAGAWKFELIRELKQAGYEVNANDLF